MGMRNTAVNMCVERALCCVGVTWTRSHVVCAVEREGERKGDR